MKIAVPVHRGRISPLFDTARHVLLVEIDRNAEASRAEFDLPGSCPVAQVRSLIATGADVLACGAISRWIERDLLRRRVRVWPGIAGEVEDVIASLVARGVPDERLRMPGWCRRRTRARQRRFRDN